MLETIRLLALEAEEGGFHSKLVWPADGPRYLVFELVGDTTARGLAAAVELRETFTRSAEAAGALFADFMAMGAVMHDVTDPQKLFPIADEPGSNSNRAVYLGHDHVSKLPAAQVEKLIRHSPPNGKAQQ